MFWSTKQASLPGLFQAALERRQRHLFPLDLFSLRCPSFIPPVLCVALLPFSPYSHFSSLVIWLEVWLGVSMVFVCVCFCLVLSPGLQASGSLSFLYHPAPAH